MWWREGYWSLWTILAGEAPAYLLPYTGGADSRYKYVNSSDLRQLKLPGGVKYTLQAVHTTLKHHYNDTLNMVVTSNSSKVTIMKVYVLLHRGGHFVGVIRCTDVDFIRGTIGTHVDVIALLGHAYVDFTRGYMWPLQAINQHHLFN